MLNKISEYRDSFQQKYFEYIKNEASDCKCKSDRHSTQRYAHKWPCETYARKCDFGLKYPETLKDIVQRYNTIRKNQEDLNKWKGRNNKCASLHSEACLNEPGILEPRITCSLCAKCCFESKKAPKSNKVVADDKKKYIDDCFCDACRQNAMDVKAIATDKKVLEDETGMEYFMREQERIHRLQDQMEKCRVKLQPNKLIEFTSRKDGCKSGGGGVMERGGEGGGGSNKGKCHPCGDILDAENKRLACVEWKRRESDPVYCGCLKSQAYEIACVNCKEKSKNGFILDCTFQEDDKNEPCKGPKKVKPACEAPYSGKEEMTFCDILSKERPGECDCLSMKLAGVYRHNRMPCARTPCKLRHMKHLLYNTPDPRLLKPPTQPEIDCIQTDIEVDFVDPFDPLSLQRRPLKQCSDVIPNHRDFDYYLTAPDIHKLRYMQNEYCSHDDWYTVY